MPESTSKSKFTLNFLMGTAIGGILGFLFAPKSGYQFRKDLQDDLNLYLDKVKETGNKIIEDAKKAGDDLIEKSNQLIALANKYIQGNIKDPVGKIENEIKSIKNAINTAVDTYKNKSAQSENSPEAIADDIFINFVNENSEDYDLLPLHEGMKKRHDRK